MAEAFKVGERLHWTDNNEKKVVTFKQVLDSETAAVAFKKNSYFEDIVWTARLDALSRIVPPILQQPVSFLPEPPPPEIPIDAKWQALSNARAALHEAAEVTKRLQQAADHALNTVTASHDKLRSLLKMDNVAVDQMVSELTNGAHPVPDARRTSEDPEPCQPNWDHNVSRGQGSKVDLQVHFLDEIKREVTINEEVYNRVTRLSAEARTKEQACQIEVHKAAASVTGADLDKQIHALAELELHAAEERIRLRGAIGFYPETLNGETPKPIPISQASSAIIHGNPIEIRDPIGVTERMELASQRQAPVKALYEALVSGNVNADTD